MHIQQSEFGRKLNKYEGKSGKCVNPVGKEIKQANWTKEQIFGLTCLLFGNLLAVLGIGFLKLILSLKKNYLLLLTIYLC